MKKSATQQGKANKVKAYIKGILITLVFLLIFSALFYHFAWKVPGDLTKAEEIRREKEVELEKSRKIPLDENAWTHYRHGVIAFLDASGKAVEQGIYPDEVLKNAKERGDYKNVDKLKELNEDSLSFADKAFKQDKFQYDIDFEKIWHEEDITELQFTRKFAQFLILCGDEAKSRGDNNEAVKRYLQALHLGQGLGRNTYIICGAFSVSIQTMALDRIKSILNNSDEDAGFYKTLTGELVRIGSVPTSYRSLLCTEIVVGHYSFDMIKKGYVGQKNFFSSSDFFINREKQVFNNIYTGAVDATSKKYPEACEIINKLKIQVPSFTLFNSKSFPVFITGYKQFMRYRTQYGGVLILSALRYYEKENGKYPDNLSQLAPHYLKKLPEDLLSSDGKYKYQNKDGNILLYSVGNDTKDDGGKKTATKVDEEGDIIFTGSISKPEK